MRHPRSRVNQDPIRVTRASLMVMSLIGCRYWAFVISIVRGMVRVTSTTAGRVGLGLTLLVALPFAHADETSCPPPSGVATPANPVVDAEPAPDPRNSKATIDGDKVEYTRNGNAVLSGNVEMRQGNRVIRADHLEYDTQNQSAKLEGGVEFIDPAFKVRGNSGSYSPVLGAQFEGAEFEL